ncbi:MAG: VWA domain-containing protein, partial [Armatimonadetes bacterium]|nr:VWA domain-containing protein [Armatimonadota bacterium]
MPVTPAIAASVIGAGAALAALYLCWKRLRALSGPQKWTLVVLRGLLLAALVAALLNPAWEVSRERSRPPLLLVALDVSASMTRLPPGGPFRYRQAREALTESELADALTGARVRFFTVSDHAQAVAAPPEDPPGAQETDLLASLSEMLRRNYSPAPAACLLVSDGADDSDVPAADVAELLSAYRIPVYCLGIGSPLPPADISILGLVYPHVVAEGSDIELQALIAAPGFGGDALQVALMEEGGATQRTELPPGDDPRRLRMTINAGAPGYHRYTLAVEEREGEVTRADNRRSFLIRVEPRQARLLLVEGHPRREYAFLRRLLLRYEDLETVLLVRKAPPGELWLDTGTPRKVGAVSAAGDIKRFRAVVLSNIEAGALDRDWLERLARFVREGGALAMLGGEDSFGAGGYAGSPLDGLLP